MYHVKMKFLGKKWQKSQKRSFLRRYIHRHGYQLPFCTLIWLADVTIAIHVNFEGSTYNIMEITKQTG